MSLAVSFSERGASLIVCTLDPAPSPVAIEELWASGAQHQQRHSVRRLGEVRKELHQGGVGPVQIFDYGYRRSVCRNVLQHSPPRSERFVLSRGPRIKTHQGQQPGTQPRLLLDIGERRLQFLCCRLRRIRVVDARVRLQDLAQRPERDPLPVRQTSTLLPANQTRSFLGEGA